MSAVSRRFEAARASSRATPSADWTSAGSSNWGVRGRASNESACRAARPRPS